MKVQCWSSVDRHSKPNLNARLGSLRSLMWLSRDDYRDCRDWHTDTKTNPSQNRKRNISKSKTRFTSLIYKLTEKGKDHAEKRILKRLLGWQTMGDLCKTQTCHGNPEKRYNVNSFETPAGVAFHDGRPMQNSNMSKDCKLKAINQAPTAILKKDTTRTRLKRLQGYQ